MTTCFGQHVTILRSIRAIIYMFTLCINISLKYNGIQFYIVYNNQNAHNYKLQGVFMTTC